MTFRLAAGYWSNQALDASPDPATLPWVLACCKQLQALLPEGASAIKQDMADIARKTIQIHPEVILNPSIHIQRCTYMDALT